MRTKLGLRYGKSAIPGIKGLFAWDPATKGQGTDIVFHRKAKIVKYGGEIIDIDTLNARYDYDSFKPTAPYTLQIPRVGLVDAGCCRGIASLANNSKGVTRNGTPVTNNAHFKGSYLVASKNIRNGQEIFVAYSQAYWKAYQCKRGNEKRDCLKFNISSQRRRPRDRTSRCVNV
jgi:hypothetical protein